MAEDAAVAQARVLLRSLYEHVNYVSQQIVKAERQIDRHANLAAPPASSALACHAQGT
ncbi:hypothetical protein [Mycobacteroides chelonae]|uniref:hypothetical protein n=1 Tax=Mycobacteroides chelonae TaxID=1774 RepID=UPI001E5E0F22|nr:hypothetical protein [Mycobacteroides chelonae]